MCGYLVLNVIKDKHSGHNDTGLIARSIVPNGCWLLTDVFHPRSSTPDLLPGDLPAAPDNGREVGGKDAVNYPKTD